MSNKGYRLEHDLEAKLMALAGQTLDIPIHKRTYRVPTSGAMRGEKGDVRTNLPNLPYQFTIECKDRKIITQRHGRVFRLSKAWLDKAWAEAHNEERWPMFVIAFKGSMRDRVWCILDTEVHTHLFGSAVCSHGVTIPFKKASYIIVQKDLQGKDCIAFDGYVLTQLDTMLKTLQGLVYIRT